MSKELEERLREEADGLPFVDCMEAETMREAAATLSRYREALEAIADFGKRNTGYGYTCSKMARQALGGE